MKMSKKVFILLMVCFLVFGYVLHLRATDYDSSNFNARDRQLQPVPTGHTSGKDNSSKTDEFGTHMAGEDCGICHTPGGKAPNHVFTMAGSISGGKAGRKTLSGAGIFPPAKEGNI